MRVGQGTYIYLSVQPKRENKTKKPEPTHEVFLIRAKTEFATAEPNSPRSRCKRLPQSTPPGGTHHGIALGDCLRNLLVLLISSVWPEFLLYKLGSMYKNSH